MDMSDSGGNAVFATDRLYDVKDIAETLKVTRVTIYDWMRRPEMAFPKGLKLGAARRWTAEEVNAWLAARAADQDQEATA